MRVLGIDPGLDITGYGIIERKGQQFVVIEAGVIKTFRKDSLAKRLNIIYSQISDLIKQKRPSVCVIEELYSHYKHPMTAILMGHARGVVLSCCSQKGIDIIDYPAKTVKRSVTGTGNASKLQVQRMINRFLNLSDSQRPADVTDALALCLTHIQHTKAIKFSSR
jgi:crossover junction endodeoxyribonuclease RuvC